MSTLPPWPTTLVEAQIVQAELRHQVTLVDEPDMPKTVAGVDLGFEAEGTIARAVVVVFDFPSLTYREHALIREPVSFPYVPGYLSFREVPAILTALAELSAPPDLIVCDGQGYAHPRRLGLAWHLGVVLDRPTIG